MNLVELEKKWAENCPDEAGGLSAKKRKKNEFVVLLASICNPRGDLQKDKKDF